MKKGLIIALVLAVTVTYVAAQPARDPAKGPALIMLQNEWRPYMSDRITRDPVVYDHALHQATNECTDCHTSDKGGKFAPPAPIKGVTEKNGAHLFCWPCHTEKKLTIGKTCTKCHKKI